MGRMITPVTPSSSDPAPSESPPKLVMNFMVPAAGGVADLDLEREEERLYGAYVGLARAA